MIAIDAGDIRARVLCLRRCGERGEFHTCATSGPMFQRSLDVSLGEVVEQEGFVYADLLLDEGLEPRLSRSGIANEPSEGLRTPILWHLLT